MRPKQFFAGLAVTSLIQLVFCALLWWLFAAVRPHGSFILVNILVMIIFSIMLYGAAKIFAASTLVRLYIQLIMIAVFVKMLLCVALIVGYKKLFNPSDNVFIWPFLFIYLTSTIYEVIYMEKVGREKKVTNS